MSTAPNQITEILYTSSDTAPDFVMTFQSDDGTTPLDLTGYGVDLHLRQPDGTVVVKTATIPVPASGEAVVAWVDGDLVPGRSLFEIQLTDPTLKIETFPKGDDVYLFNVRKELA